MSYKKELEIATYHPQPETKAALEQNLWEELEGDTYCNEGVTLYDGKRIRLPSARHAFTELIHYVCTGRFNETIDAVEVEISFDVPTVSGSEIVPVYRKLLWFKLNGALSPPAMHPRFSPADLRQEYE